MKWWSDLSQERRTLLVMGGLVGVIVILTSVMAGKEPPYKVTLDNLQQVKTAILRFHEQEGRLPEAIAELGLPEEETFDQFGEPLRYEVEGNKVTVLSFGADKKRGGHMFHRDFETTFQVEE
ncbi:MAG: hypothetical protein AAF555_07000 [Verrucomicrobiota bacterium]